MSGKSDRIERAGWTAAFFGRRDRDPGRRAGEDLPEALLESMEHGALLERILDATEEGVALLDARGDVLFANRAARAMLGLGARRSSPALAALDLPAMVQSVVRTQAAAGDERELHLPSRRRLAIRVTPFDNGALALLQDVTAARRAERIRRDFVANVSHELKTPISGLALTAEQLTHAIREDPEAALRFSEHIHQETDRLARLVVDLLDLSRIESELAPAFAATDAASVVHDATARVERLAQTKDVPIEVSLPAEPATFRADPAMAATAIANLLDNAVRFSSPGHAVRVSVSIAGDAVIFEVRDDGPGIPTEELGRIFERFYRVDKARSRATGGTGLGLSIVKHIMERHGGQVEAESEYGRGSVFRARFPLGGDAA